MSGSMRRGALQDMPPSPLPQSEPGKSVSSTQIVNGFWQFLPGKSTIFMSRIYFRNYPKPLFVGKLPPFPAPLPIMKLVVPSQQAFILKSFEFNVYEQTGIGAENLVAVAPSRTASYFAFEVKVGNRSPYDLNTNVSARGQVINYNPSVNNAISSPPSPNQGTAFPFAGPNNPLGENFASYAQAGDAIELTALVLREPPYDVRMLSAQFGGYNLNGKLLQTILSRISG